MHNILNKELQPLKQILFEMTEKWSLSEFKDMSNKNDWDEVKWRNYILAKINMGNIYKVYNIFNEQLRTRMKREKEQAKRISDMGLEKYMKRSIRETEIQFDDIIENIVIKIKSLKMDEQKLTINSEKINNSMKLNITDGNTDFEAVVSIQNYFPLKPSCRLSIK